MTITRKWSLVTLVAVLAVFAGGWFLLISPKHGEAADLQHKAQAQQGTNAGLVQQLAILKAQQADLPTKQARLAEIGQQIPDNPALPGLIRNLTAAGRLSGVSLDELAPAPPIPLAGPVPVAPVAPPADAASSTTSDASGTGTTPVPAAAPPAPTLYQVPLTVKATGSFFELEQFVNKLEGLKRSFLVTGFTVAPAGTTTTSGVATGDLLLTVQGRVFLAPQATAPAAPTTPVAAATTGQ